MEICLTATTNNQYTLTVKDSYGDSWSSGSWIAIYGNNDNMVFKGYLVSSSSETYTFSLYEPIAKNAQWKFTSGSVTGSWYDASFSDASWSNETLGNVSASASGVQYFRKTFAGLANMAAYELGMYYRYGVVAYINGVEIYRDNMPEGTGVIPKSGLVIVQFRNTEKLFVEFQTYFYIIRFLYMYTLQ